MKCKGSISIVLLTILLLGIIVFGVYEILQGKIKVPFLKKISLSKSFNIWTQVYPEIEESCAQNKGIWYFEDDIIGCVGQVDDSVCSTQLGEDGSGLCHALNADWSCSKDQIICQY